MSVPALSRTAISNSLKSLNKVSNASWKVVESVSNQHHLQTDLVFKNFGTTWKFLNEVKDHAHKLRHHPTITTTYNKVNLEITTHDVGNSLTEKDFQLAEKISLSLNILNKEQ
ncbi:hypothetical protein CAAN1_12S04126 [[Candida] anglica]|uniref:4a-hydroxytetrahydrobiopterin dehydratase n=1 Tax=[Candida] anglica TaxID=148631 RepID=A0ABP0E790_9ASCO